jgi:hypothetical protein
VMELLRIPDADRGAAERIERFLRTNDRVAVLRAANVVAHDRTQLRGRRLRHPWLKCVRVYNQTAAQASLLYPLLHLLEVSLRTREDWWLTATLGRRWWEQEPRAYLDEGSASHLRRHMLDEKLATEHDGRLLVRKQTSGIGFLAQLPMWVVQRVIMKALREGGYRSLFGQLDPRLDLDPERIAQDLDRLRDARNAVAHHRPMKSAVFEDAYGRAVGLLKLLGFDVVKAEARLADQVNLLHRRLVAASDDGAPAQPPAWPGWDLTLGRRLTRLG